MTLQRLVTHSMSCIHQLQPLEKLCNVLLKVIIFYNYLFSLQLLHIKLLIQFMNFMNSQIGNF